MQHTERGFFSDDQKPFSRVRPAHTSDSYNGKIIEANNN
jgi:hypothetical protein